MSGRNGPERRGPERPGPDYPAEWDGEPEEEDVLRDALRLIAGPAPHCSNSTTERHACRQPISGRTRGARYGADAWCDQCIAYAALDADR